MQSEVFLSYDTLGEKSALVRTLYKNLKFTINASSDLGRYLKAAETAAELVSNNIQISSDLRVPISKAIRMINLILEANPEQPEDVMLLWRIAKNSLEAGGSKTSIGIDAAWELDMLTHLRLRRIPAWIAEPDIKMTLEFGEYSIACKKLHVRNGLLNLISDGCGQLKQHGVGIIGLNLDLLAKNAEPLEFTSFQEGEAYAQLLIENFLADYRHELHDKIRESNVLDGFILSTSCCTKIADSKSDLDICTASRYLNYPGSQDYTSLYRFSVFSNAMKAR